MAKNDNPSNRDPDPHDAEIVCIAQFSYRHEAEFAQSVLAGSSIDSIIDSDDYGGLHPPLAMATGVRLMVSKTDVDDAVTLLNSSNVECADKPDQE